MSAAYLRILGHTQAEVAEAVGVTARAIRFWEADRASWNAARAEARVRWFADAIDASRKTIIDSLKGGDAASARWVLERTDELLLPPAQRIEATGRDGGPIEVAVTEVRAKVAARLARIAARKGTI